jgi:hypothetical protein
MQPLGGFSADQFFASIRVNDVRQRFAQGFNGEAHFCSN